MPRIRVDVETTFGDAAPEVVSCYFDRLRPFPTAAYGDFLATLSETEGHKPTAVDMLSAHAALFDAACVEARHGDSPIPVDALDGRLKIAAIGRLMEMWEARVKA